MVQINNTGRQAITQFEHLFVFKLNAQIHAASGEISQRTLSE